MRKHSRKHSRKNSKSRKSKRGGGPKSGKLSMRSMKETMTDLFGEETMKPTATRTQPYRVSKIKSQTERASRAEKNNSKN
jgi:hypothetical protein